MTPAAQRILAVVLLLIAVVGVVVGIIYLGDHPKRSGLAFVLGVLFAGGAGFLYFRSGKTPGLRDDSGAPGV
jgi:hypothetical protein